MSGPGSQTEERHTNVNMHAHEHTWTHRLTGVRRCRKHLNTATGAESCRLPPSPLERMGIWAGTATHQVTTPSLPWTGGSWQKCRAGKAHVGASNAKELKISWPVKNVAETLNCCMGCNYFLSPRKKELSFSWPEQGKMRMEFTTGQSRGKASKGKITWWDWGGENQNGWNLQRPINRLMSSASHTDTIYRKGNAVLIACTAFGRLLCKTSKFLGVVFCFCFFLSWAILLSQKHVLRLCVRMPYSVSLVKKAKVLIK